MEDWIKVWSARLIRHVQVGLWSTFVVLLVSWGCEGNDDRGKRAVTLQSGKTEQEVISLVGPPTRSRAVDLGKNPHDVCADAPAATRALEYDVPADGLSAWWRKTSGSRSSRMSVLCFAPDGKLVKTHAVQF